MANVKETTVYHLVDKCFVGITADNQRLMIDGEKVAKTGMNPMDLVRHANPGI